MLKVVQDRNFHRAPSAAIEAVTSQLVIGTDIESLHLEMALRLPAAL
jgi:hypothetical protein